MSGEDGKPTLHPSSTATTNLMPDETTLTTSYIVQTVSGSNSYDIAWSTLVYDPAFVSSSTETIFYTKKLKGPDRPGLTSVPVLTTVVPVIPTTPTSSHEGSMSVAPASTATPSHVPPIPIHHQNTNALIGAIVGSLLAAVLIAILAIFIIIRKRHRSRQSPAVPNPSSRAMNAVAAVYNRSTTHDAVAMKDYNSKISKSSSQTSFTKQAHDDDAQWFGKEVEMRSVV